MLQNEHSYGIRITPNVNYFKSSTETYSMRKESILQEEDPFYSEQVRLKEEVSVNLCPHCQRPLPTKPLDILRHKKSCPSD